MYVFKYETENRETGETIRIPALSLTLTSDRSVLEFAYETLAERFGHTYFKLEEWNENTN